MSERDLAKLRGEIVVRARLARGIVKSPWIDSDLSSEFVQLRQTFGTEVVADQMTPPPPFGLEQFVDSDRAWNSASHRDEVSQSEDRHLSRAGRHGLKTNRGTMRCSSLLLLLSLLTCSPVWAEQVVERQGWRVLSFDVPGMELIGRKDGKVTRATYRKKVGQDDLKITVYIRSWMGIDKFENTYREEKTLARASGESRLRSEFPVPGAGKVLTYTSTAPFEAEVIVLYSKDFRCQLMVTGKGEAEAEVEPTYQQLVKSLSMKGLSPISPIRVESSQDS